MSREDDDAYIPAGATPREVEIRRHVHRLAGFYRHLMVYAAVNLGLTAFNVVQMSLTGHGFTLRNWWAFWPLFGWGIGIASHGASLLFASRSPFDRDWQERRVNARMGRSPRDGTSR